MNQVGLDLQTALPECWGTGTQNTVSSAFIQIYSRLWAEFLDLNKEGNSSAMLTAPQDSSASIGKEALGLNDEHVS